MSKRKHRRLNRGGGAQDVKLMTEPKMYGNATVTGSFDENTVKKLAFSLRAGYMKENVTVDVCLLDRNRV